MCELEKQWQVSLVTGKPLSGCSSPFFPAPATLHCPLQFTASWEGEMGTQPQVKEQVWGLRDPLETVYIKSSSPTGAYWYVCTGTAIACKRPIDPKTDGIQVSKQQTSSRQAARLSPPSHDHPGWEKVTVDCCIMKPSIHTGQELRATTLVI